MRLVDADALVKTIESIYCKDCNNYNGVWCRACEWMDAMDYIEDAPTVDAQPVKQKHGKWLETHCDLICGVCKWEYSDELPYMSKNGYDSYYEAFAFCPHCGSRLSPPDGAVYEIEDFGDDKNGNQV